MQEKLKGVWGKVREAFSKMSKKTKTAICVVLGLAVVAAAAVALFLNTRTYPVLFTGLSADEMSSIVTYLSENGVTKFQVDGTDTIRVPPSMEEQLKADLLMQGYPKSGFAYEAYYKGVNGMSTQSDRDMAFLHDLQDRMAGVIRCLDGVKEAVVTIAQGEDQRYVLDSSRATETKASVMVTMDGGGRLTEQQATAIRNLVAHGVKGLEIANVDISDSQGNHYSGGEGTVGSADASQLKLELELEWNNRIRNNILLALSAFYGDDNIRVAVNTTVNVDQSEGESTTYTLPDWAADGSTGGQGIIGSKVYDQEVVRGGENAAGGVVGNEANADIPQYVEQGARVNGDEEYILNQGETNFDNDTDKTHTVRLAGYIADLMVSVSINSAVSGGVDIAELEDHVARAAGITPANQADKIHIMAAPFYSPDDGGITPPVGFPIPSWAIYAAAGGLALLLFLLILIAVLRKKRRRRKAAALEGLMAAAAAVPVDTVPAPVEGGADIMNIRTEKSIQLRQEIRKFAEDSPEMAAQMLKEWLKGGEDDG